MLLAREENEMREFLADVRPLVKLLQEDMIFEFLRLFTSTHPVRWEEAKELVTGDLSLGSAAFNRAHHLPSSYLRQHSTPRLFQILQRPKKLVGVN